MGKGVQYFQEGPTFSRGVKLFPGGGGRGVQMLIIGTHRTCDFSGGGANPLLPPLWIRACDRLTTRN